MENMLIYAWIVLTATVNFSFSYVASGVSKVFDGVYKGAIESSVINYDEDGNKLKPYFYKDICSFNIESYFASNLRKYVSTYTLNISYFLYETGLSEENKPDQIDIYLKTKIAYVGNFEKFTSFKIMEGKNNG